MDYNLDLWDYNSDAIDAIRLISAILNMRYDLGPTALYYSPLCVTKINHCDTVNTMVM